MSQAAQTLTNLVPPEVAAFAGEQGVLSYLPAVMEMTQRIFPNSALKVQVEDDPEIANDRHLIIEVKAPDLDVAQGLERRFQWHRSLFASCPASLVCVFRLGLETAL
jgi:hypothetical protein